MALVAGGSMNNKNSNKIKQIFNGKLALPFNILYLKILFILHNIKVQYTL